MTCSRCKECQDKGDSFCIYCGEMLVPLPRSGCDRCEECRESGDKFCRYCGSSLAYYDEAEEAENDKKDEAESTENI